ncbi:MAG: glycosyltransferase family 4 protein [bacterium]
MILYAGNILSHVGHTPTFIESLTPKLSQYYKLISASNKKNKLLRLSDMVLAILKNKKKLQLVLIDSYSMQAFWYTYVLAKVSLHNNIPYIPILRGGGYPDRLKSTPNLCKFIFSHSAKNISPSMYLKKHFEDSGFEVEYIPNFIPIENYNYKQRENVRPKLLWVRSFHNIYNPLLALEILKKLKNKYPDAQLCMVGPDKDGSLLKVREKAKQDNISDSLKITLKLSKAEWLKLSTEYDIFINTTDFDNHPVSVIEAMAIGLPVVSTNVGGLPFLIENNIDGILVNPKCSDEFVNQIDRLISDNNLVKNITINSRKKVEGFDWEIIKKKWFAAIDPLVKN